MSENPYQDYPIPLWKRSAALFFGILYMPFAVARFFLMVALFIGTKIRKRRNYYRYRFRPSDIILVTYPKSGTTWVQMILYQLTTEGVMDFENISVVSPWFESQLAFPNPDFGKMPEPRLIKSHLSYQKIPKTPCKYIYVTRDGRDALISYYHQYCDILNREIPFSRFFDRFLNGKVQYGSWFEHVHDWRRNAENLDILFVSFEDLKRDPATEIRRVADFCGIDLDENRLSRVLERTSFAFMREHEDRFGPEFRSIDGFVRKTPKKKGGFIRKGETGGWSDYFTEEMRLTYRAEYQKWFGDLNS